MIHTQVPTASTRWEIAKLALSSRMILLVAMSLSCAFIPDLYPGDDVLHFDLRLPPLSSSPTDGFDADYSYCFCLQGQACDFPFRKHDASIIDTLYNTEYYDRSRRRSTSTQEPTPCADNDMNFYHLTERARNIWLDRIYKFILPPVTKWDSARFLTLSVDPWARYPPPIHGDIATTASATLDCERSANEDTCSNTEESYEGKGFDINFYPSEQAHAFFPLLPLFIRQFANVLVIFLPRNILPPTYEATIALSAIILNMVAFVVAAISLYDLTLYMLMKEESFDYYFRARNNFRHIKSSSTKLRNGTENTQSPCSRLARTTAQIFCVNPAGVFFTAAYSESIFAMLTFAGHAIIARGRYHQQCLILENDGESHTRRITQQLIDNLQVNMCWIQSTVLWTIASYARSNGTFSSIWLMIVAIGSCSCLIREQKGRQISSKILTVWKCILTLATHATMALLIASPVFYHDWRGYSFHCLAQRLSPDGVEPIQPTPSWCPGTSGSEYPHHIILRKFSLYAYVQRKHWNVGFMKYFELKQIPNFLLAAPILILSYCAAVSWIYKSWKRHEEEIFIHPTRKSFHIRNLIVWAFRALVASSQSCNDTDHNCKEVIQKVEESDPSNILLGPTFLPYYAILAGFALVGTFLAHVQISTRLVCSSCPALYWFLSALIMKKYNAKDEADEKSNFIDMGIMGRFLRLIPMILYLYFAMYNFLGVVMHVNWLPWT